MRNRSTDRNESAGWPLFHFQLCAGSCRARLEAQTRSAWKCFLNFIESGCYVTEGERWHRSRRVLRNVSAELNAVGFLTEDPWTEPKEIDRYHVVDQELMAELESERNVSIQDVSLKGRRGNGNAISRWIYRCIGECGGALGVHKTEVRSEVESFGCSILRRVQAKLWVNDHTAERI